MGWFVSRLGSVHVGATGVGVLTAAWVLLVSGCVTLKLSSCGVLEWLMSMPEGPRLWRIISV